jgi:hypothetical protein
MGSHVARGGFEEEHKVCDLMNTLFPEQGFSVLGGRGKTDVASEDNKIRFQVKRYQPNQFQQIDRRWLDNLLDGVPDLKPFKNILSDLIECERAEVKKLTTENYDKQKLDDLIEMFNVNKRRFIERMFRGDDTNNSPNFIICSNHASRKLFIYKIKDVIDYACSSEFIYTDTVIKNKLISLQRKGGDSGKPSGKQVQVKMNTWLLEDSVTNCVIQV